MSTSSHMVVGCTAHRTAVQAYLRAHNPWSNRKITRDVLGDNAAAISIKQLGIHNSLPSHPL